MIEFSPNGKKPKEDEWKKFLEKNLRAFKESLKDFIEGNLDIKEIKTEETENSIIFKMRFKGGGEKILKIIDDFYKENESKAQNLGAKDFGVILDGDRKEFIAQIDLPKDASEEKKQLARNILEELRKRLLSA